MHSTCHTHTVRGSGVAYSHAHRVIPSWTGVTLEPVHWPTTFTVLAWWRFTHVACVTYICVDCRSAWRRLLLLRQRGVRLDVGIRCRNHVDVGGSGVFDRRSCRLASFCCAATA